MEIAHRGHLKRLVKKGLIEAKCLFRYTDDYAYDNASGFGKTDWLPARLREDNEDSILGFINFRDWDFGTSSGYLSHHKENNTYSFAIHSNLVYSVRIIETKQEENTDFQALVRTGTIEEFAHTQTGEMLKVLKISKKLTKEAFKSFNDWFKQTKQGYYSRFAGGFVLTAQ